MKRIQTYLGWAALLAVCFVMGGCEAFGFVGQAVQPTPPPLNVKAEYRGLENQKVAVLVDADQALLFEQPLVQREVCEAVSLKLTANVPGIQVIEARQVVDFQQRNLYWSTAAYADLAKRLGVTRLVLIELTEYRFRQPGQTDIWRGVISGSVAVAEADGSKPNDLVYDTPLTVAYPPDKPLGVLHADQRTIRQGTLDLFAHGVAGKFSDHKQPQAK